MNHDEIIAMAKEARISELGMNIDGSSYLLGFFERFAALVAAKERERIFGKAQSDGEMRLVLYRWENGQCFF